MVVLSFDGLADGGRFSEVGTVRDPTSMPERRFAAADAAKEKGRPEGRPFVWCCYTKA
jgi:hypothetical protein